MTTWPQNLVMGHTVCDQICHFPHICPGRDCAIATWLERKIQRAEYQALKRKEVLPCRDPGRELMND